MPEPTLNDYKLRLLLLNEWKTQSTISQATKTIRSKLGNDSITSEKVRYWFKRFDKGDISIFDENSDLHISIRDKPNDSLNSLLFLDDKKYDEFEFIKCDDRFIEYFCRIVYKSFIVQHDLILNEKKEIEIPSYLWKFNIVVDGFLLAFDNEREELDLIKLDFTNLTYNVLDSVNLKNKDVEYIRVDQLDASKFVIFMYYDSTFSLGEIQNTKIILSEFKNYYDVGFYVERLEGSKLQGFIYDDDNEDEDEESMDFQEFNLDTMETKNLNVPFDLENDESLSISNYDPSLYFWSKNNRLYGMFKMNGNQYRLLMFNFDELKWTNIKILANKPNYMFVDSNEMLTLKVGKDDEFSAFYRLNLRKPDKLKNLAHLFILRQSNLVKEKKYLKCVKRLFVTD